jgi:hypothetical protein
MRIASIPSSRVKHRTTDGIHHPLIQQRFPGAPAWVQNNLPAAGLDRCSPPSLHSNSSNKNMSYNRNRCQTPWYHSLPPWCHPGSAVLAGHKSKVCAEPPLYRKQSLSCRSPSMESMKSNRKKHSRLKPFYERLKCKFSHSPRPDIPTCLVCC